MTFERYFRLDKIEDDCTDLFDLFGDTLPDHGTPVPPARRAAPVRKRRCPASAGRWYRGPLVIAATVFGMFGAPDLALAEAIDAEPEAIEYAFADERPVLLSVESASEATTDPRLSVNPEMVLGIDLQVRGHEVKKLLYKGFGGRMSRKSLEAEEVLQEVYRGLLARNDGKCPFDVSKSSFGHYVHMVCRCVLSNYERKVTRRNENEQVGMYSVRAGSDGGAMVDAALVAASESTGFMGSGSLSVEDRIGTDRAFTSLLSVIEATGQTRKGIKPDALLAAKVLPHVYEGRTRSEIAVKLGIEPAKVGRALSFLRQSAKVWAVQQGLREAEAATA